MEEVFRCKKSRTRKEGYSYVNRELPERDSVRLRRILKPERMTISKQTF